MNFNWHSVLLVAITAIVTLLLRAIPFMIFGGGRQMPAAVKKVADLLPAAIMGVLVIYCIKGDIVNISEGIKSLSVSNFLSIVPTFVALAAVVGVHLWRKNTLLSIAVGTVIYMVLIRVIPMIG